MDLNRLNKIVKNIIKEHFSSENEYKNLENYLLDSIDFEEYEEYDDSLESLFDLFKGTIGDDIKRYGIKGALKQWLMGMRNEVYLPTEYKDIRNLMYGLGFNKVKNMEDIDVSDLFYDSLVEIILNNVNTKTHALTELENRLIKKLKK